MEGAYPWRFAMAVLSISHIHRAMTEAADVWQSGVLPLLSVKSLVNFRATSLFFNSLVNEDEVSRNAVCYPDNVYQWAPKQIIYFNNKFYIDSDLRLRVPCRNQHDHFRPSLQMLLNLAAWLQDYGRERRLPPCELGVYQPRELDPLDYVLGILDVIQPDPRRPNARKIFVYLHRIQGSPEVPDPEKYGQKAFFDQDGYSSTNQEKAAAIEHYVFRCFLGTFPKLT